MSYERNRWQGKVLQVVSKIREHRCKLAVSLALADKDFEVYQDVRVGDEYLDIKAEKIISGTYDSFYVLVKVVADASKPSLTFMELAERLTLKLRRPVFVAIVKDNAKEMMLDKSLSKRMMLRRGVIFSYLPKPDPEPSCTL